MRFSTSPGCRHGFLKACLLLCALLIPTLIFLNNEPVYDDQINLLNHAHWTLNDLLGPYLVNGMPTYWRPLTIASISIPYLAGMPIWSAKLTNIMLFFIQGCLAIAIVSQYLKTKPMSSSSFSLMILAAVMALHPVFVETTLWISARSDLLLGIFVLLGAFWIFCGYTQEIKLVQPESKWSGLIRGFVVAWLACASKDTGIVWSGFAFLSIFWFSIKSRAQWKLYWRNCAGGVLLALITNGAIRLVVLGNSSGYSHLPQRDAISWVDRLRLFVEFILRSILDIYLPIFDQAPFKSAGWLSNTALAMLLVILMAIGVMLWYSFKWLFSKNAVSAWLSLCAFCLIVFHAVLGMFSEANQGSILATRYLAPSAVLFFLSLTMILIKDVGQSTGDQKKILSKLINIPVAVILFVVLVQSLLLWTDARLSWSTNAGLWESSWNHGSRSKVVAVDYSYVLLNTGNWKSARDVAGEWIQSHQYPVPKLQSCRLYNIAIQAAISLKDQEDANNLASQSLDIAWCNPSLAENVAFLLLKPQCKLVLPMLDLTVAEGGKSENVGLWSFESPGQKEKLLLMTAFGEARCGSQSKAMERLSEVAKTNKEWEVDGAMAKGLMKSATD